MELLLSKSSMPIIGWVAELLGWIMNGIYELLTIIGIPNIGLTIILYTIIVYLCMTPLQIKQQKSSKMMSVVQPEVAKIQAKYRGKRDTASQQMMQQETQEVYAKYGISPMGSCWVLLIQLPLLLALYQVIYHIPGYVAKVFNIFEGLADKIMAMPNGMTAISNFITTNNITNTATSVIQTDNGWTQSNMVDFLYLLKPSQWTQLANTADFSSLKTLITQTAANSQDVNSFASINISQSPMDGILGGGSALVVIAAILVPVLAWFTQWLNYKLMPQQASTGAAGDMQNTMKSMNTIMPIFSAFICCTLSMGIGIYWITGAVIRCIQQVVINRRIMKMDVNVMIAQAQEKKAKKDAKKKKDEVDAVHLTTVANSNIRKISKDSASINTDKYYQNADNLKKDSLAAKAGMVRKYDQENKGSGKNSNKKNNSKKS